MDKYEKVSIENLIRILLELDPMDLIILNTSAETLQARKKLDEISQAPA